MKDEILKFIKVFQSKGAIEYFTSGLCYWFAVILKIRFPALTIIYDTIDGHFFCANDCGQCFDITGEIKCENYPSRRYIKWEEYKNIDYLHYNRILKQCVNFNEEE